jgi:RsiW-degrading membrane proteinase PrsW (M82 family)
MARYLRDLRVRPRRSDHYRPAHLRCLRRRRFTYLEVGLIQEAVKLAALWLLARRLPHYSRRDGMILGATVGLGFAAFESAGYAFNALFTSNGLSLLDVVETEVLRGILTPIGHGVWTAILGGAMFAAASRRWRPRAIAALLDWYLVVALLHTLWDASSGLLHPPLAPGQETDRTRDDGSPPD